MRIDPSIQITVPSPGSRCYGQEPASILLRGLLPADLAFLEQLEAGLPDGGEQAAGSAVGMDAERCTALLSALAPVLLPVPALPALRAERLDPDRRRLAGATGAEPALALGRRGGAVVQVTGLGRAGALVVRLLAGAGVGTLLLTDSSAVRPEDVGGAYALADVGLPRVQAAARLATRTDPTLRVLAVPGNWPAAHLDLLVVAGRLPATAAGPHPLLCIWPDADGWNVGPLLVPGRTPCLDCLSLALDRGPAPPAGEEDTAGAAAAAGLAALQALAWLEGRARPAVWSALLHVRSADGLVGLIPLEHHPQCLCRLQRRGAA